MDRPRGPEDRRQSSGGHLCPSSGRRRAAEAPSLSFEDVPGDRSSGTAPESTPGRAFSRKSGIAQPPGHRAHDSGRQRDRHRSPPDGFGERLPVVTGDRLSVCGRVARLYRTADGRNRRPSCRSRHSGSTRPAMGAIGTLRFALPTRVGQVAGAGSVADLLPGGVRIASPAGPGSRSKSGMLNVARSHLSSASAAV